MTTRGAHTTTTLLLVPASGRSRLRWPDHLLVAPFAEVMHCPGCNEWTVSTSACHLPPPACSCPTACGPVDSACGVSSAYPWSSVMMIAAHELALDLEPPSLSGH